MATKSVQETFTLLLPEPLRRELFDAAREHERSAGAEARIAIRSYLERLGVGRESARV